MSVAFAVAAWGQCSTQPTLVGLEGADGPVRAMVDWDPDGPGPLGLHVVAGGMFRTFGLQTETPVGVWPVARSTGGMLPDLAGLTDDVFALVVTPNNELIAGGAFPGGIARWTGTSWSVVGGGVNGRCTSLATTPGGVLIAGGVFTQAGGTAASNIATWNGTTWNNLGGGIAGPVYSVAGIAGEVVVAGGDFGDIEGQPRAAIAGWNGDTWFDIAPGGANGPVYVMRYHAPADTLFVGGGFTQIGGVTAGRVARFTQGMWSRVGVLGMSGPVLALHVHPPDGFLPQTLRAAGSFAQVEGQSATGYASVPMASLASSWTPDTTREYTNGSPRALATSAIGGDFFPTVVASTSPNHSSRPNYSEMSTQPRLGISSGSAHERFVTSPNNAVWRFDGHRWTVQNVRTWGNVTHADMTKVARLADGRVRALFGGDRVPLQLAELQGDAWQPVGTSLPLTFFSQTIGTAMNGQGDAWAAHKVSNTDPAQWGMYKFVNGSWSQIGGIMRAVGGRSQLGLVVSAEGDVFFPVSAGSIASIDDGILVDPNARLLRYSQSTGWMVQSTIATSIFQGSDDSIIAIITPQPGVTSLAAWNGSTFVPLGGSLATTPGADITRVLSARRDHVLIETDGTFAGMTPGRKLLLWNGVQWTRLPASIFRIGNAIPLQNGRWLIDVFSTLFTRELRVWQPACCDSIDFNRNGVFPEDQDVIDFFSVLAGGTCMPCADIDFNNNNVFPEDQDVIDFFRVLAGGDCL